MTDRWQCPPDAYQREQGTRGAPPMGAPEHRHDERCRLVGDAEPAADRIARLEAELERHRAAWAALHDFAGGPGLVPRFPQLHRLAWLMAGSGGPCPHDRALAGGGPWPL